MNICNLKLLETTPTGHVYCGQGDIDLRAGKTISFQGARLGLFKSQPVGVLFQYLFHSPGELPSEIAVEVAGNPVNFTLTPASLILSENAGNFVCLHWLNQLSRNEKSNIKCVIFHEESQLPFRPAPSRFLTPYLPDEMIASLPLLDDLSIVSRLCCNEFQPGCYEGHLKELVTKLTYNPQNWTGFISRSTHDQLVKHLSQPNNLFLY